MNEPDLNLLIALDVLLTEGSVVGAARRLGLSASAMSRTLSRLRATTGDPLLVRAGRNMVLTPYAEEIRQRTQNAAFEARALLRPSSADFNVSRLERTFLIRSNDGFVVSFGAAMISAAAQAAPSVCLRFMSKPEKNSNALREGRVDLEIGVLGEMGPEILLQTLFRDRFMGVVRKDHPLAAGKGITAQAYVSFGHVVVSRRNNTFGPVDDALAEVGLTRKIAAVVPGFSAALAIARNSDLVALIPASFLISEPAGLYAFELPLKTREITISQMWHPRSDVDPAHRWLRQLVLSVCRASMKKE
ncbi:LysR family transcriptional regulator [Rahnella sp. PD4]|uniref:LysR family transcriptional regulator n=1 Tax=Rahnella sp. PD4 TaxID=3368611 RepID=UPI003B9FC7F9